MCLGHLCWLIGSYLSLAPTLTQSVGDRGSFLMILFQMDGFQILAKDIPGFVELARGSLTSQKSIERIYNCKFSKANVLRKGRSGA